MLGTRLTGRGAGSSARVSDDSEDLLERYFKRLGARAGSGCIIVQHSRQVCCANNINNPLRGVCWT